MISASKVVNKLTEILRPIGKGLLQTVKQSPDADIFLALHIASYFAPINLLPENSFAKIDTTILFGLLAAKQYFWGWKAYNHVKSRIESKKEDVNEKALRETYLTAAPCDYFGSRYAIREFEKQQAEKRKSLAGATA